MADVLLLYKKEACLWARTKRQTADTSHRAISTIPLVAIIDTSLSDKYMKYKNVAFENKSDPQMACAYKTDKNWGS